ncbi:FtsX-like permease family protein [Oceanirhabdus sp. W0125-5]|uniref:FtsX-like permease family protein n=1 Tax=Oceanirhabdus sp. W0125-5 TaxID=2999116 RepID=UPI0022F2E9F3|nr:ABC transporter permease [Oceanirhabdus sp. W0125-5]WBW97832.1 FtsX-like permease family protein [Oceanirhabdus sp. W0125-5]
MLFRLIKKITKNFGVFAALFFGIILSLVIINSIAIYGNSLSDMLLQKELSKYETKFKETAGSVSVSYFNSDINSGFSEEIRDSYISILSKTNMNIEPGRIMATANEGAVWKEAESYNPQEYFFCSDYDLISIKNFENHVEIIEGRMFNESFREEDKNIIEVLVDKTTLLNLGFNIGELYRIELLNIPTISRVIDEIERVDKMRISKNYLKIVGVYEFKENDLFWRKGIWDNSRNHFIAKENSLSLLCEKESKKLHFNREYFINLSNLKYSERMDFIKKIDQINSHFNEVNTAFSINVYDLLIKDNNEMKLVNNMLWIIQIPLLVIVFLYILMITGIIVDRDKDEIALLKSRGATQIKIIGNYVFDGLVIMAVGLVIAPFLSLKLARYMSITDGFLQFNGEVSNNIYLTTKNIYLSLLTCIFFLGALIIPVVKASKESIVNRKLSKVRIRFSTWKKSFIDFIFIGVSLYGLYSFKNTQKIVSTVEVDINSISMDPIIFISVITLTLGLSLLFLRIYPYIIKIIFGIFKKIMPAHIFVSFSNLGRKVGKREYTMLFIMITISIGIFNLKIARTINTNVIDNIKYINGTEIKMIGNWNKEKIKNLKTKINRETYTTADFLAGLPEVFKEATNFIEPDFNQYKELESIEGATKVLKIQKTNLAFSYVDYKDIQMVAIIPDEYGKVAWMREDLTPIHWYNYLNILAKEPGAIFLSSNMKNKLDLVKLEPGKLVKIEIDGFTELFVFGGYIDYWPEYVDKESELIIGNFNYIYSKLARKPYEIWSKLREGKTYDDLLNEIKEKDINIAGIQKVDVDVNLSIYLKAINSSITISFILSMFITLIGFLIYWCICIKERELQFGILRSLGLKIRKIYTMIFIEQIFVTGVSLIIAVFIGKIVSNKFLPIISQIVFGEKLAIPVFDYITKYDYLLIMGIFVVSVIFVLGIILRYVSKIRIDQAIKIGED